MPASKNTTRRRPSRPQQGRGRLPAYAAQTQPGWEAIAAREIKVRFPDATVHTTRDIGDKNGLVLFDYPGDPRDLLELRTVEDLFAVVAMPDDLPPTFEALRILDTEIQRSNMLDRAVQQARQIQPGRGGHGRIMFRVVARQVGEASYRRVDAQQKVIRSLTARRDHNWRPVEEGGVEFWLTLWGRDALLAVRLTDETMRHRPYKLDHVPASLRPSAAAALAFLTDPAPDDVFLDPMCGAGTILIERANMGRYRQLWGGDIRDEALAVARANIGPRYKPIELRRWDARALPLDAASVDAVAVNLPFGQQIGSVEDNRTLYPATLRELARVLRPGGRLVALTGDTRSFVGALRSSTAFIERAAYPVLILGRRATVYVLKRHL
jgi:tRNA (guanine6-N2)-methyltransferase